VSSPGHARKERDLILVGARLADELTIDVDAIHLKSKPARPGRLHVLNDSVVSTNGKRIGSDPFRPPRVVLHHDLSVHENAQCPKERVSVGLNPRVIDIDGKLQPHERIPLPNVTAARISGMRASFALAKFESGSAELPKSGTIKSA
jgi:hypothetical protein